MKKENNVETDKFANNKRSGPSKWENIKLKDVFDLKAKGKHVLLWIYYSVT